MTIKEQAIVKEKLREVGGILYNNTGLEALDTFKTIELSVRERLLEPVASELVN